MYVSIHLSNIIIKAIFFPIGSIHTSSVFEKSSSGFEGWKELLDQPGSPVIGILLGCSWTPELSYPILAIRAFLSLLIDCAPFSFVSPNKNDALARPEVGKKKKKGGVAISFPSHPHVTASLSTAVSYQTWKQL